MERKRRRIRRKLTVFTERCPDLDGGEVLEERLELRGGQLRPPPAAQLLVQSVHEAEDFTRYNKK